MRVPELPARARVTAGLNPRCIPLQGGGGTPGAVTLGFQIWVNVPRARKDDDPRYGVEPNERIPVIVAEGS